MTPRRIVTGVLIAFVVASVGYLIVKETRGGASPAVAKGAQEGAGAAGAADNKPADRIIAYYFHGTQRCATCRKIEAYTQEALETGFASELGTGKLEWRVVNVEDPGNEHFVSDYQITTKTVVMVEIRGGKQTRWKKCEQTWDHVHDKFQFVQYVQAETSDYLGAL